MTQLTKLTGMLVFVTMQQGVACYDKAKGHEWKAGVVVDEDTADAFAEIYPKQAAKKVKRVDFEKTYKVAPPEGDEKNLYVITLKRNTKLADGKDIPDKYRPRVYERQGSSRVDVTMTKLPANGSYGTISIDHYESPEYGASARLKNLLVTEMIEYEGSDYNPGDEFDDDEAPTKSETKTKVKPKAAAQDEFEDAPVKETSRKALARVKPQAQPVETEDAPF